jgi:hypothetical protein
MTFDALVIYIMFIEIEKYWKYLETKIIMKITSSSFYDKI